MILEIFEKMLSVILIDIVYKSNKSQNIKGIYLNNYLVKMQILG